MFRKGILLSLVLSLLLHSLLIGEAVARTVQEADYIILLADPVDPNYEVPPDFERVRVQKPTWVRNQNGHGLITEGYLRPGTEVAGPRAPNGMILAKVIVACGNPILNELYVPMSNQASNRGMYQQQDTEDECDLNFFNSMLLGVGSGFMGAWFGNKQNEDWLQYPGYILLGTYGVTLLYQKPERKWCRLKKNLVIGVVAGVAGFLIARHQRNAQEERERNISAPSPSTPTGPGPLPPAAPGLQMAFSAPLTNTPQYIENPPAHRTDNIGYDINLRYVWRF